MSLTTSHHVYSSRGRTRQPKNLYKPYHESVAIAKASGSVTMVTAANKLSDTLDTGSAGGNGDDTQNQDNLHLCIRTTGSSAGQFQVYAYNRCFGTWGLLKAPVAIGASAKTEAAYVPVEFTGSATTTEYLVIPVHGIDRVAFVGTANDTILYAAGSTL